MLIQQRPDGQPVKVPGFTKLMPMVSGTRTQSTIFLEQELQLAHTMDFIKDYNKTRRPGTRRLSVFQIFLCALGRTIGEKPKMNRFIMNYRYYQRNHISAAFVTKISLHEDAEEVNIIIPLEPDETIDSLNEKFTVHVDNIKTGGSNTSDKSADIFGRLPVFILRLIIVIYKFLDNHNFVSGGMLRAFPFYSTVFLANLGSVQLESPLHHLFDMGTNGIFIALGVIQKEKYFDDDNTVQTRKKMKISFTYDDRIIDGLYAGKAIKLMKKLVENPEMLVMKKEISEDERIKKGLTKKGSKLYT
ncbi:MAG: 2-oxo acid dehydrogenase subunit E2 [Spirochaetales bacterium]|nr:2-oxo acid dehydrogenase subunit E2 [Spirochaetales bacterium]